MSAPSVIGLLFILTGVSQSKVARLESDPAWSFDTSNPDLACNEWFYGVYEGTTTAFIVPCDSSTGANYTQSCSNLASVETNSPYINATYRANNASSQLPFCPKSPEMQYDVLEYAFRLGTHDPEYPNHAEFNIGIQKGVDSDSTYSKNNADQWFCSGQTGETMDTRGGHSFGSGEANYADRNCMGAYVKNATYNFAQTSKLGKVKNYCERYLPNEYSNYHGDVIINNCTTEESRIICMMDYKVEEIPTHVNLTAMKEITYKYKSIQSDCEPDPFNLYHSSVKYVHGQPLWIRVLIYIAITAVCLFLLYLLLSCINQFYCDEIETETFEERVQHEINQAEFRKYVTRPISRGEAKI